MCRQGSKQELQRQIPVYIQDALQTNGKRGLYIFIILIIFIVYCIDL